MTNKPRGKSRTIQLVQKPRACDECGGDMATPWVYGVVRCCDMCMAKREIRRKLRRAA